MEQWRKIEGYENYSVSNYGRVRNDKRNKLIDCKYSGYKRVRLCNNGVNKMFFVHRLVAMAFIPNPNNYPIINHKDEIKTNNHVSNLEWCTYQYNNTYGTVRQKIGAKTKISSMGNCSRGIKVVVDGVEYKSLKEAAQQTGVSETALYGKKLEYKGHKIKYIANDN